MICPLDIRFGEDRVGVLTTHEQQYVYASQSRVPATLSPTLADIQRARTGDGLPPFLEVSLPEGYMRQTILARLGRSNEPDAMRLLRAVGGNMIGLFRAVDGGKGPSVLNGPVQLDMASTLRMEARQLLDLAFAHAGTWPGVSGGFMKLLVTTYPERPFDRSRHWIVKLADIDRAGLCAIEHFGMLAARSMGLEVPETILSDDCSRLLVERFDVDVGGEKLGFEDMCSLSGAPAANKYSSSAERIVGLVAAACHPTTVTASQEVFFAQYLLATAIRNGDAHLKNFGVLYGNGCPARLSPVYDMLSMATYARRRNDGDAADGMALTLGGTRRWPSRPALGDLARRCHVSEGQEACWQDRLRTALLRAGASATDFAYKRSIGGEVAASIARMLELWAIGVRPYSTSAAASLADMKGSIRS